jgi:hypothetical protein
MMKKHEDFKNLVYIFMKNNPNKRKSEVADRFMAIGIKRAIHRWIKLVEEKKSTKGSGRPVKIATRNNILRTKKYFNHKSGRSQKKLARRINCTYSYISYIKHYAETLEANNYLLSLRTQSKFEYTFQKMEKSRI